MSSSVDRTGRNWKIVRLADCVRIRYGLGQPPKAKDGGIPMVRATDIKHGHVVGDRIVQVDPRAVPHTRDAFLVDGDVIVVRSGAYTGDVGLYEGQWDQAIAGYDLVVSPANDRLYGPYLAAYLRSNNVQAYFRSQRDRSAQPHLNADQLARVVVPIPPIEEQHAIVRLLSAVESAVDSRRREMALEHEQRLALLQELFAHGTRRRSLRDTSLGSRPEDWGVSTLGETALFFQYGTSENCSADPSGLPVLRIPNVIGGRVDSADLKYLRAKTTTKQSLSLARGDILFVRTNGQRKYIGRSAVYEGQPPDAIFASYLIRTRLKPDVLLPQFFQAFSESQAARLQLISRASGAADGKFNINTQTLRTLEVPITSVDEQREIVAVLSACDAKIAALDREISMHEELFRAFLEELISGRLGTEPLIA